MPSDLTPPDPAADDEIVAEVRAIRHQLAAEVDFDLDRLFARLKVLEAQERARGRKFVERPDNTGAAA